MQLETFISTVAQSEMCQQDLFKSIITLLRLIAGRREGPHAHNRLVDPRAQLDERLLLRVAVGALELVGDARHLAELRVHEHSQTQNAAVQVAVVFDGQTGAQRGLHQHHCAPTPLDLLFHCMSISDH